MNVDDIRSGKSDDVIIAGGTSIFVPSKNRSAALKPRGSFTLVIPRLTLLGDTPAAGALPNGEKFTVAEDGTIKHTSFGTLDVARLSIEEVSNEIAVAINRRLSASGINSAFESLWEDWKGKRGEGAEKPLHWNVSKDWVPQWVDGIQPEDIELEADGKITVNGEEIPLDEASTNLRRSATIGKRRKL